MGFDQANDSVYLFRLSRSLSVRPERDLSSSGLMVSEP
jgi:hypothetical protein